MESSFLNNTDASILAIVLFTGMVIMVGLGSWVARTWHKESIQKSGVNALLGSLFALFGFMLAFTFGMSGSRYESIRDIVVEEANSIGTAALRADLYPDSIRTSFRVDFKNYLDARIAYYNDFFEKEKLKKAKEDAAKASTDLWAIAMRASKLPNMLIPSNNMVPALNSMFDDATKRESLARAHVPDPIVYMLFILGIVTSFIVGFTSSGLDYKDWIIVAGFLLLSCMIIYITLDLGRPMRGLIQTETGQKAIEELRSLFN
jgi:hypothetical protein